MTQAQHYQGEHQTTGLLYYRRSDGIEVYRFTDSTHETVDAWAERVLETERAAEARAHIRAIYDIRGQWITAHAIRTMFRVSRMSVPLLVSSVAIIGQGLLIGTLQIALDHLPRNTDQVRRIFSSEDAALRWLEQKQQEAEKKNA